jgi:hypothetical protein
MDAVDGLDTYLGKKELHDDSCPRSAKGILHI